MRCLNALLVLFPVLLTGCQAGGDSTRSAAGTASTTRSAAGTVSTTRSATEDKASGGMLRALRPDPITVPEGTTLPLLLDAAISSATSRPGDHIVARLAEDVRVGEKVVVPAGSEVRGRVTAAVPSGRVKTRAHLAFDFDTLVLKGEEHSIGTKAVDITAGDNHKKDAATIGIGAGAGAVVGAIVDGKKGAGTRVTVKLTRETRL